MDAMIFRSSFAPPRGYFADSENSTACRGREIPGFIASAEVIIAVDISAIPEGQSVKGAVDILLQTFNIMGHAISQYELRDADVVMRPKLEGIGSADFGNRRLSILAGREAALMVMPQLKERIAARTR